VVRPNTQFKPNWHLEALAHKLSQVAAGEVKRLIVTMPPRNLKSLFASVALPAWFLGHNPSERVVTVSYSDQLARTHANDFRRLVNDPIYQATFPAMRLARDTDREIVTTMRGKRYTTSIEGTLTGLGGNLVIIDDPLKQDDAHSEAVRRRAIEWYRSTLLSRPDDKQVARILLVMQRVHQDDLAGYLRGVDAGERRHRSDPRRYPHLRFAGYTCLDVRPARRHRFDVRRRLAHRRGDGSTQIKADRLTA
jgi:hypothetical protein